MKKPAEWKPNDASDNVEDWSFDKLKRWAVAEVVEAFIMEGTKGVSGKMHWVLVMAMRWGEAKLKREKGAC